jgi:hypothetical protein
MMMRRLAPVAFIAAVVAVLNGEPVHCAPALETWAMLMA